jgi:hypothetical protein
VALIVLDASVVIAHLDAREALHTQATNYLDSHAGDDFRLPASAYAEVLVEPARTGRSADLTEAVAKAGSDRTGHGADRRTRRIPSGRTASAPPPGRASCRDRRSARRRRRRHCRSPLAPLSTRARDQLIATVRSCSEPSSSEFTIRATERAAVIPTAGAGEQRWDER